MWFAVNLISIFTTNSFKKYHGSFYSLEQLIIFSLIILSLFNSKELETEKSKNDQMRTQINALQANSASRDMEKLENQANLRNRNLEKHMNEMEDNLKNLNALLTQERVKVNIFLDDNFLIIKIVKTIFLFQRMKSFRKPTAN